jgi:enoyl-CoA hydratase/carnithine racemase
LTGDEFTAEQGLQWGMIQEIVPPDQLHYRAREIAGKIARAAPLGVQACLKSSKIARFESHEKALRDVFNDMPGILSSEDAKEGIASFMERRDAKFIGR